MCWVIVVKSYSGGMMSAQDVRAEFSRRLTPPAEAPQTDDRNFSEFDVD